MRRLATALRLVHTVLDALRLEPHPVDALEPSHIYAELERRAGSYEEAEDARRLIESWAKALDL